MRERLGEDDDFDAAGDVVEHEDAMRSPFRVFSGRRPETMPPTQTSASELVSSAIAPRAEGLQLLGVAIERMAAHVEAERLLLAGELLRSRSTAGASGSVTAAAAGLVVAERAEQLSLALVAVALMPAAVLDRPVDGGEQPRAAAPRHAPDRRGAASRTRRP